VGNFTSRKDVLLNDCVFVANKCERTIPDEKTATKLGLRPPQTAVGLGVLTPPTMVTATAVEQEDAVKITWAGVAAGTVGFRVERQIAGGKWQVIAYRPLRLSGVKSESYEWVDFVAPPGKELTYRVVALATDDSDKGASMPSAAITLPGGGK
jgi:hypothetical protein